MKFAPSSEEFIVRGSLDLDLAAPLRVKLRGTYGEVEGVGLAIAQRFYCPTGTPQGPFVGPGPLECELDHRTSNGDLNPALNAIDRRFPRDGAAYSYFRQMLLSAEAEYAVSDALTLTSLTGYYRLKLGSADHSSYGAIPFIDFADTTKKRSFTQELRLASSTGGAVDFLAGGFFEDSFFSGDQIVRLAAVLPYAGPLETAGTTLSPFAQAEVRIAGGLSLSGGLRYTHEKKRQRNERFAGQLPRTLVFEDVSPEIVLSWKPARNVNLYGGYKEGYKAGGFQTEYVSLPQALGRGQFVDNRFDKEEVRGFEGGAKASLADRQLTLGLALYDFEYTGLQLGRFDPAVVTTVIQNVGAADVRGVEADLQYRPRGTGFNLFGTLAYNKATFSEYLAACYNGQTAAEGCFVDPAGLILQDLAGRSLPRAPRLVGSVGGGWETRIRDRFALRFDADMRYSGSYDSTSQHIPEGRQPDVAIVSANVTFGDVDGRWELALIGKNLADELYVPSGFQIPVTGRANSAVAGRLVVGSPADLGTTVNRGRELVVRLTFRR